ncbi:MAG: MFS transporter, partial [Actinomycetota bacterium]|nr:MFS transporter [Actinomycetota bacterium]
MQPIAVEVPKVERRWKVLLVVSVAVFMASLDLFIVNIAFPEIARDFEGADVAQLSWVLNAYAIVFAALLVAAGRLSDRAGRRRGFLGGLLLFLAGSALSGLAPSLETLVAARVIQATGAAFLVPTSLALLLPEFPAKERATAIGIWAA